MESGRFTALVVIVVALVGGMAYYAYSQIQLLQGEIADLRVQSGNSMAAAGDAKTAAAQAKTAVDNALASLNKAGDVAQLTKQASDWPLQPPNLLRMPRRWWQRQNWPSRNVWPIVGRARPTAPWGRRRHRVGRRAPVRVDDGDVEKVDERWVSRRNALSPG